MSETTATAIPGADLLSMLEEAGSRFFTGVPCSLLTGLIRALEDRQAATDPGAPPIYVASVREDESVGLASGSAMAGVPACVLMQNSGLGNCLNALASLNAIYDVPLVLLVSWRGYQGNDAPEHILMGEAMPALMETFGIPAKPVEPGEDADAVRAKIAWVHEQAAATRRPAALFIRKGVVG